jgi:hypothetical protein
MSNFNHHTFGGTEAEEAKKPINESGLEMQNSQLTRRCIW